MRCRGLEAISCQTLFSSALKSRLARGSDASGTPCDVLACIWHWRLICQLPASLGGTRLGHSVLLLSGFGFRICKCLADRRWAQRDCQTRHRARLEKATARSVVWLFHVTVSVFRAVLVLALCGHRVVTPSPLSVSRRVLREDKVARSLRVTREAGFHQSVVAKRAVFVEVTKAPAARRSVFFGALDHK